MRTTIDVCGPDKLKVLQQIFDSVWLQMKQDPTLPCADDDTLREQVSRRVMEFANRDVLDVNGIKRKVLNSFKAAA